MTRVVSMRLQENQLERLRRVARRMGRTPSELSALLVEEGLIEAEFAYVDFRDSSVGRQAYIKGSGLAVWEVFMVARDYGLDVEKTAAHLRWPAFKVKAALNYAKAFPDQIEDAIADNEACDFEALSRVLPQIERFTVPEDTEVVEREPRASAEIEGPGEAR